MMMMIMTPFEAELENLSASLSRREDVIIIIIIGVVWTQDVVLCAQIVELET